MTIDDTTRRLIVDELHRAHREHVRVPRLSGRFPDIAVDDAYAIQEAFIADRVDAGARIAGWKVGLTSEPMQRMAGTTEPDFSAMTDTMFTPEATEIDASTLFSPLVEIEIAFVMKERLQGPGVLPVDVIRATDFVVPAIEVVDFRVELGPGFGIVDTVADLAACGTAVLGANPRRLDQIDVRRVVGSIHKNGELVEQGTSDAVLGNPVTAVAWLANKLSQFGVTFEPGHTILTGSFTAAVPVGPGDVVVAEFDHGLGPVSTSFSTKENDS